MFTMTLRLKKKRLLLAFVGVLAVVVGAVLLWPLPQAAQAFAPRAEVKCPDNAARVSYLSAAGWEAAPQPVTQLQVIVPPEFDAIYEAYNEIQKAQGFNLARYQGQTVMKYTYLVQNYPQAPTGAVANLLVYRDKIIAADLCSLELGGFILPLKGSASAK